MSTVLLPERTCDFEEGSESVVHNNQGIVLVVDDMPSERRLLEHLISDWGYTVLTASSGEEAIQLYQKHRPTLVLMDIIMPGMGGSQAAKRIKELSNNDFLIIIFMTGLDSTSLSARDYAVGSDFMPKTSNPMMLKIKLDGYERLRALHNEIASQRKELTQLRESELQEQGIAFGIIADIHQQGAEGLAGLRYVNISADILCGDVLLARRRPSGGLNVLIADLTGHGLAAAVGALPVAQIFNAMTLKGFSAENIIREINSKLINALAPGMFCAATFICFSDEGNYAEIWNGGMPDLIVLDRNQPGAITRLPSQHLPMGILDSESFDSQMEILEISSQNYMYVFSDGLTEAENNNGEFFSEERLDSLFEKGAVEHAFDRVADKLKEFCHNAITRDDISFLEIPCDGEHLFQSGTNQRPGEIPLGRPWSWEIRLAAESLSHLDPVPIVLDQLIRLQGLEPYSETLFTILSELYNNALDHGILELDSALKNETDGFERYYLMREKRLPKLEHGMIQIKVTNEPMDSGGRLTILVRDTGDGFDTQSVHSGCASQDAVPSGRGLGLIHELSDCIEYLGNGNCVRATLIWYSDPQKRA